MLCTLCGGMASGGYKVKASKLQQSIRPTKAISMMDILEAIIGCWLVSVVVL